MLMEMLLVGNVNFILELSPLTHYQVKNEFQNDQFCS